MEGCRFENQRITTSDLMETITKQQEEILKLKCEVSSCKSEVLTCKELLLQMNDKLESNLNPSGKRSATAPIGSGNSTTKKKEQRKDATNFLMAAAKKKSRIEASPLSKFAEKDDINSKSVSQFLVEIVTKEIQVKGGKIPILKKNETRQQRSRYIKVFDAVLQKMNEDGKDIILLKKRIPRADRSDEYNEFMKRLREVAENASNALYSDLEMTKNFSVGGVSSKMELIAKGKKAKTSNH